MIRLRFPQGAQVALCAAMTRASLGWADPSPASSPAAPLVAPLVLQGERLRVEFERPGALYRGARFGRGGFVRQVTLDGRVRFCTVEPGQPLAEAGAGLCAEFGPDEPPDYARTPVGNWFSKPGVGWLRRPDAGPYGFWHTYETRAASVHVERVPDGLRFVTQPMPLNGVALRLVQRWTVSGNRLCVRSRLENQGTVEVRTREYRHNFLNFDGDGPLNFRALKLRASLPLGAPPPASPLQIERDGSQKAEESSLLWASAPTDQFFAPLFEAGATSTLERAWWQLQDARGQSVREEVRAPVANFQVWGTPRGSGAVSPELLVRLRVAPHSAQEWERDYLFEAPAKPKSHSS